MGSRGASGTAANIARAISCSPITTFDAPYFSTCSSCAAEWTRTMIGRSGLILRACSTVWPLSNASGMATEEAASRLDVGSSDHLRIGGVAQDNRRAILLQIGDLFLVGLDDEERRSCRHHLATDEFADPAMPDKDDVIGQRRHRERPPVRLRRPLSLPQLLPFSAATASAFACALAVSRFENHRSRRVNRKGLMRMERIAPARIRSRPFPAGSGARRRGRPG